MESQLGTMQQSLQMLAQQQDLQHEKIVEVSLSNQQLTKHLDGLAVGPVSLLSASVDSLKEKFESDLQLLRDQMTDENRTTNENWKLLTENFKKWKGRVKEINGKQSKWEGKQEEIDRLAALLEQQREEDVKASNDWHAKLQRLEEIQAEMVQEHSKHIQEVRSMLDSSMQDIEKTLKSSMEANSLSQEVFQARVLEHAASDLDVRMPEVMSRLLEQPPWQDFAARLSEQEETQHTLLQELQEFHQSMNEIVTRQKQFFQQRLQEDETARNMALYQLQENWNQAHQDSIAALKDDVLSEMSEMQDKTVAKMVEISKENIHLWQKTFQDWETQLSNLTSRVRLVEDNLFAIAERHRAMEEEAHIRKEREDEQEMLRRRVEEEKQVAEEENQAHLQQQKNEEANRAVSYLASPLAHQTGGSEDAYHAPDVTSLQDFHALMERVQSDIQALDHHRMDIAWTPKSFPSSNFSDRNKEKESEHEEAKDKSSKKAQKKRKSSKKGKQRSSRRSNRHRKHHSSSDDDDDDSTSSSSSSGTNSEDEETGDEMRAASSSKRAKRKSLPRDSPRLNASANLQSNHRNQVAIFPKFSPSNHVAIEGKAGIIRRGRKGTSPYGSLEHSGRNNKTMHFVDEEEDEEEEVLTGKGVEAKPAARDNWNHIEFPSDALPELASALSASLPVTPVIVVPVPSGNDSYAPTSASKEQQTSPIHMKEGENEEFVSIESELAESDFDPECVMQLVIEKRRNLRSQLRPELFGKSSSQLLHHLPVTSHEQVLSSPSTYFSITSHDFSNGSNIGESSNGHEWNRTPSRSETEAVVTINVELASERLSTTALESAAPDDSITLLDVSGTTPTQEQDQEQEQAQAPAHPTDVVVVDSITLLDASGNATIQEQDQEQEREQEHPTVAAAATATESAVGATSHLDLESFEVNEEEDRYMCSTGGLSDYEESA
jgi:hypothetical protein